MFVGEMEEGGGKNNPSLLFVAKAGEEGSHNASCQDGGKEELSRTQREEGEGNCDGRDKHYFPPLSE